MNAVLSWAAPRRHLFVFGHMRSYSSLLCHILGSHPDIDGYCETHIKYRWYFDLVRLRRRVVKLTGEPLRGRYVLDKVLHDYPLAGSILRSPAARAIVLLRRPKATVRSIMNMGLRYSDIAWYRDVDAVARYYETRLSSLVRFADQMGGRAILLEAEELLSDTPSVLARLAGFLELGEPLKSTYRRFAHTGKAGYGDPSENIARGERLLREAQPGGGEGLVREAQRGGGEGLVREAHQVEATSRGPEIIVPEPIVARLDQIYRARTAALRDRLQPRSRSA